MGNCLFQPPDTVKNYFTSAFQAFYIRMRSGHSKVFIYLKSLKIICQEDKCNEGARNQSAVYEENTFTDPLSCILPSFSQNSSRLLLPKGL